CSPRPAAAQRPPPRRLPGLPRGPRPTWGRSRPRRKDGDGRRASIDPGGRHPSRHGEARSQGAAGASAKGERTMVATGDLHWSTEQPNPASLDLDTRSTADIVETLLSADASVAAAVAAVGPGIAAAAELV